MALPSQDPPGPRARTPRAVLAPGPAVSWEAGAPWAAGGLPVRELRAREARPALVDPASAPAGALEVGAAAAPGEPAAERGLVAPRSTGGAGTGGATGTGGGVGGQAGSGAGSGGSGGSPCPSTATAAPGESNKSITVGTLMRTYLLHVPPSYTGKTPVPVVFDFHGLGGSGASQKSLSGWATLGDSDGFITVFP